MPRIVRGSRCHGDRARSTTVLALPLTEASAKVSAGPPEDGDGPDGALDVWAGNIPLVVTALEPVADPALRDGIPVPAYAAHYERPGLTTPPAPGRGVTP